MSGVKVAAPVLAPVTLLPLAIGVAAIAVQALVEKRLQAAREALEQARRRAKAVTRRQNERIRAHGEAEAEAANSYASLARAADALSGQGLAAPRKAASFSRGGSADPDSGPDARDAASSATTLESLHMLLASLPREFKKDERWPYARLEKQYRRHARAAESGAEPEPEELESLEQTIRSSLARFLKTAPALARVADENKAVLLDELALCKHLAQHPDSLRRIELLEQSMRENDSAAIPGSTRDQVRELRREAEKELEWFAFRSSLAGSMLRHLSDMEYDVVTPFTDPRPGSTMTAKLAVPGGERLDIEIKADGVLDFRLFHVLGQDEKTLSPEELRFYRAQEQRWSRDYRELIRRLTREGYSYTMQVEDLADEQAIPVAIMETAQDILREEEERARQAKPKQRTR